MRAIQASSILAAAVLMLRRASRRVLQTTTGATPEPTQESMGPVSPPSAKKECAGNPDPLGVARVVEIDTTGGPGFGFQHYKTYDFLNPKEVVLTFDDGPLPNRTTAILAALDAECTKATFFSVGKVAGGYPEILRDVAKSGHTIGAHTVNHKDLSKMKFDEAKDEIERSVSASSTARSAVPTAPFFRFPFLQALARDAEVSRRPQHGRILHRHRQLRLQGRQGRRSVKHVMHSSRSAAKASS